MRINERWLRDHGTTQEEVDQGLRPGPLIMGGLDLGGGLRGVANGVTDFFLGTSGGGLGSSGQQGAALSAEAGAALQELAAISREQFDFFRGMAQEYRDFVVDSPMFQNLEAEANRLTSEAGQTEEAGRFRANVAEEQARARDAEERRTRSFGLDRSSPAAQSISAGRTLGEAQQLAGAGNAGRESAMRRGAGLAQGLAATRATTFSPQGMSAGLQGTSNAAQGFTNLAGQQFAREAGERDRRAGLLGDFMGMFNFGSAKGGFEPGPDEHGPNFAGQRVEDAQSKASETDDRVPAQLSAGEYVATAESVKFHGQWLYDWLEEAARRGIPGLPKFMQKLDMSEVPARVAGREPKPRQGQGIGAQHGGRSPVDHGKLKGGSDLVNNVSLGRMGLFPREVRANTGGFGNDEFFEIIRRGRGIGPSAPTPTPSASGRDAGVAVLPMESEAKDVSGPSVLRGGKKNTTLRRIKEGQAARTARASFGLSPLAFQGANRPMQPIVRTG